MKMCDTVDRRDGEEEAAGLKLCSKHFGKSEIPNCTLDGKISESGVFHAPLEL